MKKIRSTAGILLVALIFLACGGKKSGGIKVDNFSNGKAGEIILIMDNKYWSEENKELVKQPLLQPQPAINQIEPMFDILEFQNSDFTAHYQRHRNIVRFDVNPDYSGNTFSLEYNTFSSPQTYIHLKGNNVDSLIFLYNQHIDEIIRALYANDLKRIQTYYAKETDPYVEKLIREKFNLSISVPHQYEVARNEADFLWLLFRTSRNDRMIMIYKTPATALTEDFVLDTRDSMTRKYIPGAVDGAYPIIARKLGYPIVDTLSLGNKTGLEMRGLWESVNDKMGGPFYSFTFIDPSGSQAITIDGFVYAPQENKRDYLREVEAIVKSIR